MLEYVPSVFARHALAAREKVVTADGLNIHINEHGYRGRRFSAAKPTGTVRVMVYGGSSVFDADSPEPDDWPHRAERLLRESGYHGVEVINAGIPGHASFDAVGRLFAEGHTFAPDYVVLYSGWNDIKQFGTSESLLRSLAPMSAEHDPR